MSHPKKILKLKFHLEQKFFWRDDIDYRRKGYYARWTKISKQCEYARQTLILQARGERAACDIDSGSERGSVANIECDAKKLALANIRKGYALNSRLAWPGIHLAISDNDKKFFGNLAKAIQAGTKKGKPVEVDFEHQTDAIDRWLVENWCHDLATNIPPLCMFTNEALLALMIYGLNLSDDVEIEFLKGRRKRLKLPPWSGKTRIRFAVIHDIDETQKVILLQPFTGTSKGG